MSKQHNIFHVDKQLLTPSDKIETFGMPTLAKSVRGFVVIENEKGERFGENLVVLKGREFLAEKFSDIDGPVPATYANYKIRYFGIGSGGAEDDVNGDPVVKKGPYANDDDLYIPAQFQTGNSADGHTYIDNGYLKEILADATQGAGIEILQDTHTITTETGTVDVQAYTTIKFTMFINGDEPPASDRPFEFNEAGLWAVEYDSAGNPVINADGTANKVLIAHFTTTSKFLEGTESVKIEWYILV